MQFAARPYVGTYVDSKYALFGMSNVYEHDMLPNHNIMYNLLRTRDSGALKTLTTMKTVPRYWYAYQIGANASVSHHDRPMEELLSLWNTDKLNFCFPGETFQYTWMNNNPYWYNGMAFSHGNQTIEGTLMGFTKHMPIEISSTCNPHDNKWTPGTNMYWQTRTGPNYQVPGHEGDHTNHATPGRSCLSQQPNLPGSPPPIALIEVPPLLNSKDETGHVTWQCTIVYKVTLQVETMSGSPQFAGWQSTRRLAGEGQYNSLMERSRSNLYQFPTGVRNYAYVLHHDYNNPALIR